MAKKKVVKATAAALREQVAGLTEENERLRRKAEAFDTLMDIVSTELVDVMEDVAQDVLERGRGW
jgi:hypothetical protein